MSSKLSLFTQLLLYRSILCCSCRKRCYKRNNRDGRPRHPVLLRCGHCMCEACVRNSQGRAGCGSCGAASQMPSGSSANFPRNAYLVGRISIAQKMMLAENLTYSYLRNGRTGQGSAVGSGSCYECSRARATVACQQCRCRFCDSCFAKVHSAGKSLREHTPEPVKFVNLKTFGKCPFHQSKSIEFFCKTCEVYGCSHCFVMSHQGEHHMPITVRQRNSDLLGDVSRLQREVEDNVQRMLSTSEEVKLIRSNCMKRSTLEVQKDVVQNFVYLHGLLQVAEEKILQKLSDIELGKRDRLDEILNQLEFQIETCSAMLRDVDAVKDCEQLQNEVSMEEVMHVLTNMKNAPCRLDIMDDEQNVNFWDRTPTVVFNERIVTELKDYCSVILPNDMVQLVNSRGENNTEIALMQRMERAMDAGLLRDDPSLVRRVLHQPSAYSLLPSAAASSNQNIVEGNSYSVYLCYVKDPGEFYVIRSGLRKQQERIEQLAPVLARRFVHYPRAVAKDEYYLAEYVRDRKWYRGRVVDILPPKTPNSEPTVMIYYLDYGNTQEVPISRLREMPEHWQSEPPMALKCKLFDCVPKNGTWCKDSTKMMLDILDDGIMTMFVMKLHPDLLEVDLCQRSQDETSIDNEIISLRDSMVFMEYAIFAASPSSPERKRSTAYDYLRPPLPEVNHSFQGTISFVESLSEFYIQKLGPETSYLVSLMERLDQTYDKNNQKDLIYNPVIGMPCIALYFEDEKWYRGEITDLPGNEMVTVLYVDYGNEETVHWKFVRKIQPEFMKLVPQAMRCALKQVLPLNNLKWKSNAVSYLENLNSEPLEVTVAGRDNENNMIKVILFKGKKCINAELLEVDLDSTQEQAAGPLQRDKPNPVAEVEPVPGPSRQSDDMSTIDSEFLEHCNLGKENNSQEHDKNFGDNAYEEADDSIEQGFRTEVQILSVTSPSDMYVSVQCFSSRIEELEDELQDFYKSNEAEENVEWQVDNKCAVLSSNYSKWLRGTVVEILNDGICRVEFSDAANAEDVPVSNMRKLDERFLSCPPGAIKCHMSGIFPPETEWPGLTCEFLMNELEKYDATYITKMGEMENDSLPILLSVKKAAVGAALEPFREEWVFLNDLIVEHGLAVPEKAKLLFHMVGQQGNGKLAKIINENDFKLNDDLDSDLSDSDSDSSIQSVACDWMQPILSEKNDFVGQPTFVDENCIIYMHDVENDGPAMELISQSLFENFNDSKPNSDDYWSPNQICVVKYYVDNGWYRGKILEAKDDLTFKVLFVDYGNIETCQASDLRRSIKHFDIPTLARKYKLFGVSPVSEDGKWTGKVSDFLYSAVVEKRCNVTVVENAVDPDGISSILLTLCENGVNVAEDLVESGLAVFDSEKKLKEDVVKDLKQIFGECSHSIVTEGPECSKRKSLYPDFKFPARNTYFPIEVATVRESDFSAHILDEESVAPEIKNVIAEFVALTDEIQKHAENQPGLINFIPGEPCISLYSDNRKWYRAEVIHSDLERNLILVHYVDYGNKEYVTRDRIRQILPKWISVPKMALDFKLHGVRKSQGVKKSAYLAGLTECLSKSGLIANVIAKYDNHYEVEVRNKESSEFAYGKMINDGLMEMLDDDDSD